MRVCVCKELSLQNMFNANAHVIIVWKIVLCIATQLLGKSIFFCVISVHSHTYRNQIILYTCVYLNWNCLTCEHIYNVHIICRTDLMENKNYFFFGCNKFHLSCARRRRTRSDIYFILSCCASY